MALVCGARQSHLFAVAPGLAPRARVVGRNAGQAADSINDWYPEKVNQAFSLRIKACASVTALLFAGIRNRGCLPPRQIIKAMVDHCNPGTASPAASCYRSDERRLLSLPAKRLQVIATNFAGVRPWRGNRLREENGRVCSRAGSV